MSFPEDRKYTETHEWVKMDGEEATIGLDDYAQSELGDIVFVNLPEVGDEVKGGEAFTDLESVKAVADVYSPVNGVISAVNEDLADNPALINEDPYGAWIIKVEQAELAMECYDAAGIQKLIDETPAAH